MFDGRIDLVLAGYNAGENAAIKSGYKVPHNRETRRYVARGVSVFGRIAQANILSVEPVLQVHPPKSNRLFIQQSFCAPVSACSLENPIHPLDLLSAVSGTYSGHFTDTSPLTAGTIPRRF